MDIYDIKLLFDLFYSNYITLIENTAYKNYHYLVKIYKILRHCTFNFCACFIIIIVHGMIMAGRFAKK